MSGAYAIQRMHFLCAFLLLCALLGAWTSPFAYADPPSRFLTQKGKEDSVAQGKESKDSDMSDTKGADADSDAEMRVFRDELAKALDATDDAERANLLHKANLEQLWQVRDQLEEKINAKERLAFDELLRAIHTLKPSELENVFDESVLPNVFFSNGPCPVGVRCAFGEVEGGSTLSWNLGYNVCLGCTNPYADTTFVCSYDGHPHQLGNVQYTAAVLSTGQSISGVLGDWDPTTPFIALPWGNQVVNLAVHFPQVTQATLVTFDCIARLSRPFGGSSLGDFVDQFTITVVPPGYVPPPEPTPPPPGGNVTATLISVRPLGVKLPGETVEVVVEWDLPEPASVPNNSQHTWIEPEVRIGWSSDLEHLYSCGQEHAPEYGRTQCRTRDEAPVRSGTSRTQHFFRVNPQLSSSGQEHVSFSLYDSGTSRITALNQNITVGTEPRAAVSGTACPAGLSPCVRFGRLVPGERAVATLTVINTGSEPFDFHVPAAPVPFSQSDWGSGTVQPALQGGRHYASQTFDMVFEAPNGAQRDALCTRDASGGFYSCERSIMVTTTDPKLPAVAVRLIGQVYTDPVIEFTGDADANNVIDFGVVPQGDTAERTLVISNAGGMFLEGYVDTYVLMTPANFIATTTGQDAFRLWHDSEERITLSVAPSSRGIFQTGFAVHWWDARGRPMSRTFTLRVATGPSMEVLRVLPDETRETLAHQQTVDFGSVQLAPSTATSPAPLQQDFVIRNTTSQPSTLNAFVQVQDNSQPRTWELLLDGLPQSASTPLTIASGAEELVSVRFMPREVGTNTDFLHVQSDAGNQPGLFSLRLRAEVEGPPPVADIALYAPLTAGQPNDMQLGGVPIGQEGIGQIRVRNAGPEDSTLHLEVSGMVTVCEAPSAPSNAPVCTSYTLSDPSSQINVHSASGAPLPLDLDNNDDDFIIVEFQPVGLGTISGTIEVLTNDPNQTSVTFNIDGEGTRFRVPPIVDLTQYPDPVTRNRAINASYHEFDLAMTHFLGTPVISNWATYGKHASASVGMQLHSLKVGLESMRAILAAIDGNTLPGDLPAWAQGLSLTDRIGEAIARLLTLIIETDPRKRQVAPIKLDLITQALLVTLDSSGVPRPLVVQIAASPFSQANINQLISLVPRIILARQRILDNLQRVYDELTLGNAEIYQHIAPVYVQFLTLANQSPGGNPPPLTLPLAQDLGGYLTIAFSNYAQAKIIGDQARLVINPQALLDQRRALVHQANIFAVYSEQLYIAQIHYDMMFSQVAATDGFTFSEDICTVMHNTVYRLARNWGDFYSRMGFDPAVAPPFPALNVTPANFPPFLPPTDRRYAGTIVDYFTTWLHDTTCIHNPPLQAGPNPY